MKTILISGGSVAGPAFAWWARRHGFSPTIVERAPGPPRGGHAVDVRGVALRILDAMGLRSRAEACRTQMRGMAVVDATGAEIWRSEAMTMSGGSFDRESIEIMRDEMAGILLDALPADIECLYGDSVRSLEQDDGGVDVLFASGAQRRFDFIIGADGSGSNIRRLVFGPDDRYLVPFGLSLASFSVPNMLGLDNWQVSYRQGGDGCSVYTLRGNTHLRISFMLPDAGPALPADRPTQMAHIRARCGHYGWEVPGFLDQMATASDFHVSGIAQISMDRWTSGRVALVGDAGYCPSPFSGQGTSCAIVGAYLLAWELAQSPGDHGAAFDRYETRLRPFVEANQALVQLTRGGDLSDPEYYSGTIEPAIDRAKNAIMLDGLS